MIKPLTPSGKAVFAAVNVVGVGVYLGVVALTVLRFEDAMPWGFVGLLLATLAASIVGMRLPGLNSVLSLSDTFVFIAVIVYGPLPAVIVAGTDGFLSTRRHSRRLLSALSSLSVMSISVLAAGFAYRGVLTLLGGTEGIPELRMMLLPLGAMALVHYLVNSALVASLTAVSRRMPVVRTWKESYAWTALNFVAGATVAGLVLSMVRAFGLTTAALTGAPILVATYLTYRLYLGRVEDKNLHIEAMNRVHLRALEVLAMAIDARGQSSAGHMARVQAYASELADLVGLDDDTIEAIRTAALLHDVGKLAIPDYILNKPGTLTPAEWSKLKTYPEIGAKILEQVDFPHPVAPVVHYHRENWDGSGYPEGLAGEDIPIGARIVSLAESIDAMRSTRSYRPAFTRGEIMEHLRSSSERLFDPQLARLFLDNVEAIEEQALAAEVADLGGLEAIEESQREHARSLFEGGSRRGALEDISAVREEAQALLDLAQDLGTRETLKETLGVLMAKLRSLLDFDTGVIYLVEENGPRLLPALTDGRNAEALRQVMLRRGEGVSGWALENVETMLNVQAQMDFFAPHVEIGREYHSAAVVPMISDGEGLGTISLYHGKDNPFTSEDQRILELIAPQASRAIENARSFEKAREGAMTDALTGLANSRFLFVQIQKELARALRAGRSCAIGVMDLDRFKPVNDTLGHHVGDEVLRWLGAFLRERFRAGDTVCRWGGDEFVVLLPEASAESTRAKLDAIQRDIDVADIPTSAGQPVRVGLSIGWSVFPEDGESYEELIRVADKRMYRDKAARHGMASGGRAATG